MTPKLIIEKKDQSFAKITAEASIRREIKSIFTYEVPGAQYSPKYRAGFWDGTISLYNANSEIYLGLIPKVEEYCKKNGYDIAVTDELDETFNDPDVNLKDFYQWSQQLKLTSDGEAISPRDYQLAIAYKAMKNKRGIFKSATGTGKSLALYMICRHLIDVTKIDRKILILVPTVNLVEQMYGDFADYSEKDDTFYASTSVSKIYSGKDKTFCKKIVVSTWQSLQKIGKTAEGFPAEWFQQFDAILVDETHTAEGAQIKRIIELCTNTEYRIGVSGTIRLDPLSLDTLQGLIGAFSIVQTTKQAMDAGHLAALDIKAITLDYRLRKDLPEVSEYSEEIDFLVADDKRNRFITNLAVSMKGNTIVFFTLVEKHGRPLYKMISEAVGKDRNVYIVEGDVDVDVRERIRRIVETESDAIILASYGTSQMGTNYKNIHNGIFASFSKSMVRVLQSIGRGLRKTKTKDSFKLFDISDNLNNKNASLRHLKDRLEIYAGEEFKVSQVSVNI